MPVIILISSISHDFRKSFQVSGLSFFTEKVRPWSNMTSKTQKENQGELTLGISLAPEDLREDSHLLY
jgi:hypothetical protein